MVKLDDMVQRARCRATRIPQDKEERKEKAQRWEKWADDLEDLNKQNDPLVKRYDRHRLLAVMGDVLFTGDDPRRHKNQKKLELAIKTLDKEITGKRRAVRSVERIRPEDYPRISAKEYLRTLIEALEKPKG